MKFEKAAVKTRYELSNVSMEPQMSRKSSTDLECALYLLMYFTNSVSSFLGKILCCFPLVFPFSIKS